ncbi:hypothetical protein Acr_29g0007300 [Actinidia rufa]|uniref:Uncharacterized protein n=1 Tax=Actinidia rufa TaxID=165716 RepID=A0A7J0HEU9_9ERIC|nr:hypothetical protein Acr_29g0007300 [Actinidia rufa]
MANTSQASDLEGIHGDMHGITKQIKIMNEINARLVQHLATNNPLPPAAPIPEDVDRSHRSCQSSDQDSQCRHSTSAHEDFVKWPGKIKTNPLQRNRNKYCEFHKDHGHNTEDYFQLREQIVNLIKRGYLRKFVADRLRHDSLERGYADNMPTISDIPTIHGGFRPGGCSISSPKSTLERLIDEHRRNGSSADILFISAFDKMKIRRDRLHLFYTPIVGFRGSSISPLGWIKLPLTLEAEPYQTIVWQDFIVVDCPSPYNSILDCPTFRKIKAITSTYHLMMKFPTSTRIGEVQENYLAKDLRMVAYLDEVKAMLMKIKDFKIRQILRETMQRKKTLAMQLTLQPMRVSLTIFKVILPEVTISEMT